MCKTCAGRDPVAAWKNFRQQVTELGGIVLELAWQGALTPHLCRCANGHECRVIPNNIQQGQGLCRICADRNNPVTAERKSANAKAFYQRVAELGGTVLEPEYLGSEQPHLCLCAAGHECRPTPHSLQSGQGMCKICAWQEQDVLYVVRSPVTRCVKFGITSNGGTSRLRHHRYAGFTEVIYLRAGLPKGVAICTEQEIKAALAVIGAVPAQGREFFSDKYVGTILDEINRRIF
jgi:hypothetical protein